MSAASRVRRRWLLLLVAMLGTLVLTGVVWSETPRPSAACLGTLVPAYVEPQAIDDLTDGAPGPRLLIINPSSGPGASSSRAYRRAVERAQASGAHVLGYVASTFGARAASAVEADVARYREWYGVDGIFLDEVAHDAGQLPYYEALAGAIRATGESLLVLNPGTVPARGYFALADLVVTYEGPFSDYAPRLAQEPAWVRDVPPAQIAHLVYATTREQAVSLFAAPARSGSLYVTSGTPPNPWGTPPPYLREEQAAITSTESRSPNCSSSEPS